MIVKRGILGLFCLLSCGGERQGLETPTSFVRDERVIIAHLKVKEVNQANEFGCVTVFVRIVSIQIYRYTASEEDMH